MAERNDIFQEKKPNNLEARKPPDRIHAKPVAHRSTKKQMETTGQKFIRTFLAEDVDDLGGYFINELLVPTLKNVFMNFMDALLWGNRAGVPSYRDSGKKRTDYSRISSVGRVEIGRERRRREREDYADERRQFDILNVPFDTKAEAEMVLTKLEDCIYEYGRAQVAYLYDLIEETGPYTAEYYGWTSLRGASIKRTGSGYTLILPRPVTMD